MSHFSISTRFTLPQFSGKVHDLGNLPSSCEGDYNGQIAWVILMFSMMASIGEGGKRCVYW